jgi:nifR3 family TIM-barrel protein
MLYHPVKIGSLELKGNLFLAPVAGYSDRAFRSVCIEGGADFTYTEMVSSEALTRGSDKTTTLMSRAPNEPAYAVQLFGGNPEIMADAARIVLAKTSTECIDINCGCPVPKIVKTGAGAALTRDPERLYSVVKSVVAAAATYDGERPYRTDFKTAAYYAPVPVTVKIRSGWDSSCLTWKEAAQAAVEAGAAAITLHARTRAQGYEGKADWGLLKQIVDFIDGRIPVFGSGDVFTPEDAAAMLRETKCSGVMFARGAMGHPFIFERTRDYLTTGSYREIDAGRRIKAGLKELELLVNDKGESAGCREMRKRFCAYSKGLSGGAALRTKIVCAESVDDYRKLFSAYIL